ncbi:unnamed protein product [Soboliphyme baturini]|uniref:Uncharacterized protein n=1 Tax=Soboliphyme baturini TaxID=241478 RepID=A0A183ID38_9BILA|nr:unnamed protein product [Soboliphyme baturini]
MVISAEDVVVHDCRKPSIILREQYHIHIREVFDTQIAYHLIQQQESDRTVPFGPLKQLNLLPIPFTQLQQVYDPVGFVNRQPPPPTWSTRPVTDEVLSVASEQALSLLPTIYRRINRLLSPKCMGRFYRLCQESVTAPSNIIPTIPDKMVSNDLPA